MLFVPNTSFINQLCALLNFRLRDAGQPGKKLHVCSTHVLLFKKSQDKKMTVAMN